MTNSEHPIPDDELQLADLLRTVRTDAAEPDKQLLRDLRQHSLTVFQESALTAPAVAGPSEVSTFTDHAHSDDEVHQASPRPERAGSDSSMSRFTMKTVLTLTAAVLATLGIWFTGQTSSASSVRLSEIFESLRQQNSLQLQIRRADTANAVIWVKQPGLLRWEESPTSYRIARGSRLWKIEDNGMTVADLASNKAEQRAASSGAAELQSDTAGMAAGAGAAAEPGLHAESVSPHEDDQTVSWFDHDGHIDLFALLNIVPDDPRPLMDALPEGTATWNGHSCYIYTSEVTSGGHPLLLQIYVDRSTRQLAGIAALDLLRKGAPPVAELTLVAMNPVVDEAKFKVPVQLAEQDYIGKITDTQGLVTLRPAGVQRWTPVHRQLLVQPRDWIRT
ncbi:MAG: hypothetical protein KDA96_26575, partial [Planctomycetaceae bacterium]|nr:hypothetical protein [Planctomycetaceae bacterium]